LKNAKICQKQNKIKSPPKGMTKNGKNPPKYTQRDTSMKTKKQKEEFCFS
jgi:hypothetical protein